MKKEDLEKLRPTIKMALEKAANYCAYQERCMKDVRIKLYDFKLDTDDVEEVITLLINDDFLNEERYSKIYCRSKFNQNKWGKNKIIQHLKLNNISERNIVAGLNEIKEDEYLSVLAELIEKKKKTLKDKNHWTRKQKIVNYVIQKGYEYEKVKQFL